MKTEVRTLGVLAYAALLAAVLVPITSGTAALAQNAAPVARQQSMYVREPSA